MRQWIVDTIRSEPVLVMGLIQAGLAMALGFGLSWTAQQEALVLTFAAALMSVIVRSKVSPIGADTWRWSDPPKKRG